MPVMPPIAPRMIELRLMAGRIWSIDRKLPRMGQTGQAAVRL